MIPAPPAQRHCCLTFTAAPFPAWGPSLNSVCPYHQLFAPSGWSVLLLNPRGSDGYGAAFAESNVGACGIGDVADLLEPIDLLVADETVDPAHVAVTGYSYGGFMTCRADHRHRPVLCGRGRRLRFRSSQRTGLVRLGKQGCR